MNNPQNSMEVKILVDSLDTDLQDKLLQVLQEQFSRNNDSIKHNGALSPKEVWDKVAQNQGHIANLYIIERALAP